MSRKTVLLGLMAVFTISNLASMFAPSYEMLIVARFVAGLPHGAFFGVAAMVASFLMGPKNRAKAVAHVMTGLTVATVIGVPMASWLGQALGWRSAFGLVVVVGVMTLTAIAFWLPPLRSMHVTSPLTELGALKRVQVWLAMLVGMVGFGGMFAVYTYISTTMTDVAGMPRALVPLALMVFGLGMVVGNLLGGKMADGSVVRSLYATMSALGVALTVFVLASHNPWTALLVLFAIGAAGSAMGPALQIRLMDVAHDGRTLAACLNHSALNMANAIGALVGGLVIAAGCGRGAFCRGDTGSHRLIGVAAKDRRLAVVGGDPGPRGHRRHHPAVVEDVGAGEIAGPVAGAERQQVGHLLRLAPARHCSVGDHGACTRLGFQQAHLGLDGSR
jgi:DHA1 family inner membrane transport protein